jgi:chromatin segregation and condensation protein Rec8/ScpA/Scc1 (kleisin family)
MPEFPQQIPEEVPQFQHDSTMHAEWNTTNGPNILNDNDRERTSIAEAPNRSKIDEAACKRLETNLRRNNRTSFFQTARGMSADGAAALFYQVLKKAHYTTQEISVNQDKPYGDIHISKKLDRVDSF